MTMRRSEAEAEFLGGFDAAAKQDAEEFKRIDARIAELEAVLMQARKLWVNVCPYNDEAKAMATRISMALATSQNALVLQLATKD